MREDVPTLTQAEAKWPSQRRSVGSGAPPRCACWTRPEGRPIRPIERSQPYAASDLPLVGAWLARRRAA
jgi:hypothetical protein